jgi:hypothetical protein
VRIAFQSPRSRATHAEVLHRITRDARCKNLRNPSLNPQNIKALCFARKVESAIGKGFCKPSFAEATRNAAPAIRSALQNAAPFARNSRIHRIPGKISSAQREGTDKDSARQTN